MNDDPFGMKAMPLCINCKHCEAQSYLRCAPGATTEWYEKQLNCLAACGWIDPTTGNVAETLPCSVMRYYGPCGFAGGLHEERGEAA
ncbi:MAG TPA: hypothetical protein VK652_08625 [Steroidobacteraceae bacterium]|nr:hypothetical protein [Steroidobacteraceae bacterium]